MLRKLKSYPTSTSGTADQHQNVITFRGSPVAHAYQVLSHPSTHS